MLNDPCKPKITILFSAKNYAIIKETLLIIFGYIHTLYRLLITMVQHSENLAMQLRRTQTKSTMSALKRDYQNFSNVAILPINQSNICAICI